MLLHQPPQPRPVAPGEGRGNRLVFADRRQPAPALQIGGIARPVDAPGEGGVLLRQRLVARRGKDRLVNGLVHVEIARPVPRLVAQAQALGQLRDPGDIVIARLLGRQFPRHALERRNHRKDLRQFFARLLRHPRPAVGQEHNEAFIGEHLQGLAHRRARYTEAQRQLPFRHLFARLQLAFHDHAANTAGEFHRQNRPHHAVLVMNILQAHRSLPVTPAARSGTDSRKSAPCAP